MEMRAQCQWASLKDTNNCAINRSCNISDLERLLN